MLLAGKVASTGILLILLAAGSSGPRPSPLPIIAIGDEGVSAAAPENDVKRTQQALHDKKHYRGKVDGSVGLQTRAGIRAYQKAESLPITGQIDTQTAAALGVRPEPTSGNVQGGRIVSHKEKPSAGTARVVSRASKARRKDIAQDRSAFGVGNNRDKGANR
jgi:peptidoglycan hydrolase-like protein with peptidoglycan-binding domain